MFAKNTKNQPRQPAKTDPQKDNFLILLIKNYTFKSQ
jgi:hypothetical protein